jgi:curved DNA-binding protein CbpA
VTRDRTHYEVLGIDSHCDLDAIKRAFRRQALATHPDQHPDDPDADQKFIRVAHAYEVLSEIHQRAAYDYRTLRSRSRTADYGITIDDVLRAAHESILGSKADDALEEYIVGIDPPAHTTLMTFFQDLERTEIFVLFRDGKEAYQRKRYERAEAIFRQAVEHTPQNILYHHHLGLAYGARRKTRRARREFKRAIEIGLGRYPILRCPGVHRALYDLHRSRGHRLRAWWYARQHAEILFDEPMTLADRERMRLKKIAYQEGLRAMEEEEKGSDRPRSLEPGPPQAGPPPE